jgi:puromycin-sensitive aminopeptidase
LRATVINVLGTFGRDEAIMAEAASRFDAGSLHGDLADAIVAITMHQQRVGDVAVCEQRRASAATPQDEQRYLFAPAGTDDVDVAMESFGRAYGDVRTQDAPYLIGALVRNRVSGPVVWRAMSERWAEAIERFPVGSAVAMAAGVVTFASDAAFAREVRRFHQENPVPAGQQQVAQILDLMDLNVSVAERNAPTLAVSLASFLG